MLVASLALVPRRLTDHSTVEYEGIAESAPEISVHLVAVVGAAVVAVVTSGRAAGLLHAGALLAFLVGAMHGPWAGETRQWAGVVQYALAPLAWIAGTRIGRAAAAGSPVGDALVRAAAGTMLVQVAVASLQVVGVDLFSLGQGTALLMGTRANGTMWHPNILGQVAVLLALVMLPASRSPDPRLRRTAVVGLVASLAAVGLSGSRAAFVAATVLVLVWGVTARGAGRRRSIGLVVLAVGVCAVFFATTMLERFLADPTGGSRSRLMAVALDNIPRHLWFGVGPNSYVAAFGQYDERTAGGLPVHNVVLLAVAELGILGAVLLLAPVVVAWRGGWLGRRRAGTPGESARALVASVLPIAVLAVTDHKLLADHLLPLWFLTTAVLLGAAGGPGDRRPTTRPRAPRSLARGLTPRAAPTHLPALPPLDLVPTGADR